MEIQHPVLQEFGKLRRNGSSETIRLESARSTRRKIRLQKNTRSKEEKTQSVELDISIRVCYAQYNLNIKLFEIQKE